MGCQEILYENLFLQCWRKTKQICVIFIPCHENRKSLLPDIGRRRIDEHSYTCDTARMSDWPSAHVHVLLGNVSQNNPPELPTVKICTRTEQIQLHVLRSCCINEGMLHFFCLLNFPSTSTAELLFLWQISALSHCFSGGRNFNRRACTCMVRDTRFYNSAISKHVIRAHIVVEMGSHPTRRFLFNHTTPFSTKGLEKSLCDFTGTIFVQCENPVMSWRRNKPA